MTEPKFVLVVGGSSNYYEPFEQFGKYSANLKLLRNSFEKVNSDIALVLFTGGEDVDPALYGEPANVRTGYNSQRDAMEAFAFIAARRHNLPMVGVCRGAQFLCVMSGGKLVQHVDGHSGNHPCRLWDERIITVSSTHHQMQIPPKDAEVIGWLDGGSMRSKIYRNGMDEEIKMDKEIEIVYYQSTRSLGMQHHPEMQANNSDGFKIAAELVKTFLLPT